MTGPSRAPLRLTEIAAPLVLLGVLGGGTLVMTVTWMATWVAASLSGAWTVPGWGSATVSAMAEATRLANLDPLIGAHGSRGLFWTAIGVQTAPLFAVAAAVTWWISARGQYGTAARSLARRRDVADMWAAAHSAARCSCGHRCSRPRRGGAAGRRPRLDPRDMGMRLGRLGRHDVYASEEDVVLEIAGPRSNKTSALVVPAVLSAVGPVVTTSNKVDVYTLTVGLRAQVGRVFVLDPQRICGAEQTWWWNALAGITDMADAQYLVTHFSQTVGAGHERADPYFTKGAERLIGQLFVAAHTAAAPCAMSWTGWPPAAKNRSGCCAGPGCTRSPAVCRAPSRPRPTSAAASTRPRSPHWAAWSPRRSCATSPRLSTWLTPPGQRRSNRSRSSTRGGSSSATRPSTGSRSPTTPSTCSPAKAPAPAPRWSPPWSTTCCAPPAGRHRPRRPRRPTGPRRPRRGREHLPDPQPADLYSYFGSMSIQAMTWLQSYQQGVDVWGRPGMDKLWSAATMKLIGAGVHDASFCEDISRLVGEHDVPTWSDQRGVGQRSSTLSTRRDRILSAADIAALPKTTAVLISAGRKPGQLTLLPWYAERDAQEITDYATEATTAVRTAAIAALGPANPLAQLLDRQQRGGS